MLVQMALFQYDETRGQCVPIADRRVRRIPICGIDNAIFVTDHTFSRSCNTRWIFVRNQEIVLMLSQDARGDRWYQVS